MFPSPGITKLLNPIVSLSIFVLKLQHQNVIFDGFFTSKRYFGSYFQRKGETHFEKICSSTKYQHSKFIKKVHIILVTLLRFFQTFSVQNTIFKGFFTCKKP